MRKILAMVDDARLGRAVAGLLDGRLKVVDVQRGERGVSARILGTRDEYAVYIEGRRVYCSCRDYYERKLRCTSLVLQQRRAASGES